MSERDESMAEMVVGGGLIALGVHVPGVLGAAFAVVGILVFACGAVSLVTGLWRERP